jgi:tRNA1Val (adenine37-N6)-methyltransferase
MKVGTDGVLLGAWTQPGNARTVLDLGTGTGLIALMIAQKSNAVIDAIDIDKPATEQAEENFCLSPWAGRLNSIHESIQLYSEQTTRRYDLIVSNPPYFMGAHPAPDEARNVARHMDDSLSIEELTACVKKLLEPHGRFCVILPFMEGMKFLEYAETHGLFANHLTKVKTKSDKTEKRLMMEFELVRKSMTEDELTIQEADDTYTDQYIQLTKDYYVGLPKKR